MTKAFSKQTESRKNEHLQIVAEKNVEYRNKPTGLGDVRFEGVELEYKTLPEINKKEITLETKFLGKKFALPFFVSGMTGGTAEAQKINREIAVAVEKLHIGMGVGSQRAMIENPKLSETYNVRKVMPNAFLAGNIGIAQLLEYPVEKIEHALDQINADALAVHLNAGQEAVQTEGDTDFKGAILQIKKTVRELKGKYPVYVKEVGNGIDSKTAGALSKAGVAAIDVQGAGGTSWVGVEVLRKKSDVGEAYWDFGIPTAVSIVNCRKVFKGPIIASGGIRNGLDAVKAFVLGADLAGMARPVFLSQQKNGSAGVTDLFERMAEELRTGMFLVGAKNLSELKKTRFFLEGKTRQWLEKLK
ncbi:MAG: type 2 isopentenyl-diphosphate Delta-isomerase [Candidatus Micrarchaeota archaeon]